MGSMRKTQLIGDICAVTMVLSGAAIVASWILSFAFDDVRIKGFGLLAMLVFVGAGFVFHVAEGR